MWPCRIKSRSYREPVDFAPLRGHSVTVNWSHSRNTKGTSVVSVPRWEGMAKPSESVGQQPGDVPAETAISRFVVAKKEERPRSEIGFSTDVRSVLRNRLSERCVSCVSSAVALRKHIPVLRTDELRTCEWRRSLLRRVTAYPPASPKDTLRGVFERIKRAARAKKSARISERLAHEFRHSASLVERRRESGSVRPRRSFDA